MKGFSLAYQQASEQTTTKRVGRVCRRQVRWSGHHHLIAPLLAVCLARTTCPVGSSAHTVATLLNVIDCARAVQEEEAAVSCLSAVQQPSLSLLISHCYAAILSTRATRATLRSPRSRSQFIPNDSLSRRVCAITPLKTERAKAMPLLHHTPPYPLSTLTTLACLLPSAIVLLLYPYTTPLQHSLHLPHP